MQRPRYLRLVRQVRSFGENLSNLRASRNLDQTALAKLAGLDRGTINKLENGRSDAKKLTLETLWKLATALDLTGVALHGLFIAADPSWEPILTKLRDATVAYEGGLTMSLEGHIEIESSLDARGKTTLLNVLEGERSRVRERQREGLREADGGTR